MRDADSLEKYRRKNDVSEKQNEYKIFFSSKLVWADRNNELAWQYHSFHLLFIQNWSLFTLPRMANKQFLFRG